MNPAAPPPVAIAVAHPPPAAAAAGGDALPLRLEAGGRAFAAGAALDTLLVAATLGLALPWALTRWRRRRHAHTVLAGRAFAFDGGAGAAAWHAAVALALVGGAAAVAETGSTAAGGAALAMAALLLPWLRHAVAHHEVAHTRWAGERLRCTAPLAGFYALALRGLALAVLLALLLAGALAGIGSALGWQAGQADASRAALAPGLVAALALAAWLGVLRPLQRAARWNLTWRGAGHGRLRLDAQLRGRTLVALAWRHALLLALTLGLYAPWAAVAAARARVQALRARVTGP